MSKLFLLAQGISSIGTIQQPSVGFTGTFSDLITTIITLGIAFAALAMLLLLAVGGFLYITAGDDEEQAESGRGAITNAIIGIVLVASAFILFELLARILNLDSIIS